jgi:ABC-type nitrate/sulfonate/bicarbonate transport system permease component
MGWLVDRWPSIVGLIVILTAWEIAAALGWIKVLFFPPPSQIMRALLNLLANGELLSHIAATLLRLAQGFMLGALPGLLMGLLMGWSMRLRRLIDPFVAAFHSIPKIAMLPLALVIFGIGEAPKIVLIAISSFFPMLISVMVGVQRIQPVYYEVAQNYGARRLAVIQHVLLPASLPEVMAGVRLGLNTALVITIALEMIASNNGLGDLIWLAWQTMRVDRLYATLLSIALLGVGISGLIHGFAAILIPWSERDHS